MRTLPLGLLLGLLLAPLLVQPTDVTARTRVSPTTSDPRVSIAYLAVSMVFSSQEFTRPPVAYITDESPNTPPHRTRADRRLHDPDGPTERDLGSPGDTIKGDQAMLMLMRKVLVKRLREG
jgi:hypothetical protein